MAQPAVKVHGLKELNAALKNYDDKLGKQFLGDLKKAVEPVVTSARGKVTRFHGASVGTIRSKRSGVRVFVEQSKAKVTGARGDFGALQMSRVLVPALAENEDTIVNNVEETLDHYAREEGF